MPRFVASEVLLALSEFELFFADFFEFLVQTFVKLNHSSFPLVTLVLSVDVFCVLVEVPLRSELDDVPVVVPEPLV